MNIFPRLIHQIIALLLFCWISSAVALEVGDELLALDIDSSPMPFSYNPNGKSQLIVIYPLAYSSRKVGEFNNRVIEAGYCPKSIVDMMNRAWYAPIALAEKEIEKGIKTSPNPNCTVTSDYEGIANKHWGLKKGPVVIVVNGKGIVSFFHYGILTEAQEQQVLELLK